MEKVILGLSGGVDSSVAAAILKKQGYEVIGITFKFVENFDAEDAIKVAKTLNIEHHIIDYRDIFKEKVIDKFLNDYKSGITPNPCVICNKNVKLRFLLDEMYKFNADYIATGHYATIIKLPDGRYTIKKPVDVSKDQTYVLYRLTQEQLKHTLFPLSEYTKPEIREIAEKAGLINSRKPDSQDICFVPDGDYAKFIKEYSGYKSVEGDYIDINGNVIGKHSGMIHYTVGQRKGLGVTFGKPMFVKSINAENNTVMLCEDKDLYTSELFANDLNFMSVDEVCGSMKIMAKTRYSQKEQPAMLEVSDGIAKVVFDDPQRAFTKGQSVVFYHGDMVIGGGKII